MDVSPYRSPTGYRPENDSDPRILLCAGVLGAAAFSFIVCGPHRPNSLSLRGMIASAIGCAFLVLVAYAASLWMVRILWWRATSSNPNALFKQSAFAAIWLAPLSLYLQQQSGWVVAIASVLGATMASCFCWFQSHAFDEEGLEDSAVPFPTPIFSAQNASLSYKDLVFSLAIGICAELALVTSLADQQWIASVLSCSAAVLFVRAFHRRVLAPQLSEGWKAIPNRFKELISISALIVMLIGLLPYLRHGGGSYGEGVAGLHHTSSQGSSKAVSIAAQSPIDNLLKSAGGDYAGIILWPKVPQTLTLVAPVPSTLTSAVRIRSTELLTIPFAGVYWFFKAPDSHPSAQAHSSQGTPRDVNIRSVDDRPLIAEAHQSLGSPIDLNCCKSIQVAIQNADHFPGTVYLELILRNTKLLGKPFLSLGAMDVTSTRPWKLKDDRPPANEILTFTIPPHSKLRRFDELTVVFHIAPDRSLVAARMGIDRFILIPRGS